ncbi:hypothetical protein AURDEDRAFT_169903 [Auricularia subglabra TFB-10046 SS5]|nr:hypothetical protein AURDEDRAFT_169903 [Auricularia subglabra TFB-10046 SS5]
MHVWGQPAAGIGFQSVDSWFAPELIDEWKEFARELSVRPKPWKEVFDWIGDRHVQPFKMDTTLGRFHLTNQLVEAGLVIEPTIQDIAEWIARCTDKGAFAGLIKLGFTLRTTDDIAQALSMIDTHIKLVFVDHLKAMNYGTIVLENILCKVSRINSALSRQTKQSLEGLGNEYFAFREWLISSVDTLDLEAFRRGCNFVKK